MSLRNHSCREVLKVLRRHDFVIDRQRGSHIVLKHPDGRRVSLVNHDPIKEGTLRSILDQANISKEQFLNEV